MHLAKSSRLDAWNEKKAVNREPMNLKAHENSQRAIYKRINSMYAVNATAKTIARSSCHATHNLQSWALNADFLPNVGSSALRPGLGALLSRRRKVDPWTGYESTSTSKDMVNSRNVIRSGLELPENFIFHRMDISWSFFRPAANVSRVNRMRGRLHRGRQEQPLGAALGRPAADPDDRWAREASNCSADDRSGPRPGA